VRVCFLIDRLSRAGTETQLVALIRNLDRSRVQPILCLKDGEDDESRSLEPDCCPVFRLGLRSICKRTTPGRIWRLVRLLREQRVDVLQVYFPESTYLGVLAGRLANVPRIVRTRNNIGHWMTSLHRLLRRLWNPWVDVLVANSEASRRAVIADEAFPAERVVVLENGVDLDRFPYPDWRANGTCRGGGMCVGIVANLRPVKGLDVFVRAAALVRAAHPGTQFVIAGEGVLRPDLERLRGELGLGDSVSLPGAVDGIPEFLAGLDVAVLSSHAEGMPNSVLEYMTAGKAIVATGVGGSEELIKDGVHGLLVPPADPARLAAAVCRLLSDPALAERLGKAARQRVEERFSRQTMVRRFEAFYWRLLGRPPEQPDLAGVPRAGQDATAGRSSLAGRPGNGIHENGAALKTGG
jgi:glycosyltransferase involved in cell wall biosynthesis